MNFGLLFSLFLVFVNGFCATRRRAQYTAKPLYSRLLHQDGSSLKELCADKSPYYEGQATLMGNGESDRSHLALVGGGIFFYWQAGVIEYLREQDYDLNSCTFSGASAGALTATLAATEVDFYEATDLALKMAADVGVWDRRGGLQGIWGPLIEEWLQTLLPPSIENIEGRLSLLVTPVPSFGKKKISTFLDKNDLIKCNMASVHLVSTQRRSEIGAEIVMQMMLTLVSSAINLCLESLGFWTEG